MMNANGAGARLLSILWVLAVPAVSQTPAHSVTALPESTANIPVQKIGVDDLIGVTVYDAPELTRAVRVAADGAIRLPLLKAPIPVVGLLWLHNGNAETNGSVPELQLEVTLI